MLRRSAGLFTSFWLDKRRETFSKSLPPHSVYLSDIDHRLGLESKMAPYRHFGNEARQTTSKDRNFSNTRLSLIEIDNFPFKNFESQIWLSNCYSRSRRVTRVMCRLEYILSATNHHSSAFLSQTPMSTPSATF